MTATPPLELVPFPVAGLLYASDKEADSKGVRHYRRVYLTETTREPSDFGVEPWVGVATRDEMVDVGPDGLDVRHCIEYSGDQLQNCLERLHAEMVYRETGRRTGPYADEPVDLDALPVQAKQAVLDDFAADLEVRREPRRIASTPQATASPVPEPAGRAPLPAVDIPVEEPVEELEHRPEWSTIPRDHDPGWTTRELWAR
jgi:hypothetical protein